MGFSTKSSNGGKRRGRRGRSNNGLMSEINVTPFVDVMLVLLIIFMVSAPLLVNGVPLDLPKTSAGSLQGDQQPLTVSIDDDGKLAVNDEYYDTMDEVVAKLTALLKLNTTQMNQRIVVRGAKAIQYQDVLNLLATIQQAGFQNVALASLPQ